MKGTKIKWNRVVYMDGAEENKKLLQFSVNIDKQCLIIIRPHRNSYKVFTLQQDANVARVN